MIVFDTNLVSEAVRYDCDGRVRQWLATCAADEMCTTAITVAELKAGVAILPEGIRKQRLSEGLDGYVLAAFGNNILAFDTGCTGAFAAITAAMRMKGRSIGFADCQIAAIAMTHGLAVATRDTQPFADAGVKVVNPWAEE